MSSPILVSDSAGPFVNDRYMNSFKANSSLAPGNVVKIVASQTVDAVSQTSELVLGVVWDSAIAGRAVNVITRGIVRVTSDNAVVAGDLLVAGQASQFHDTGSSGFSFNVTPTSGAAGQWFPRAIALDTQATVGSTFLAALL